MPIQSGAIIEDLLETYDRAHDLSFETGPERALLRQWLYFQASFQGPPLSQVFNFSNFETDPDARSYLVKESVGVMDSVLQDQEWLVGGRINAADLAFVPYYAGIQLTHPNLFAKF